MMNVTFNSEKNGIEIRFDSKPEQAVLDTLKQNGFRWSGKQHMWFAKQTDDRKRMLENLGSISSCVKDNTEKQSKYELWDMTRIEGIGNHVDKSLQCKDIAAACRKHLRTRFPMCKISVTSTYSSIGVAVKSSPFTKDSAELKAIVNYCDEYVESYKYCIDYDPYGDYGSTYNFYGGRHYTDVDYNYIQMGLTDEYKNICEAFANKRAEFEKAEEEREQREYEAYLLKQAEEEKRQKEYDKEHEEIESAVAVSDANYFVLNVREAKTNKHNSISDYEEQCEADDGWKYTKCHVTRELHFSKEIYDLFTNHLMDDFDFISGMGGDETTDYRVHSFMDYMKMTDEERSTVDLYCKNAIAVFCDGEMMFIIDAQGFSYSRHVFLVCDESKVADKYECKQVLTQNQRDEYAELAEKLEDASADIILNNGLLNTWHLSDFNVYKKKLVEWIKNNRFPFDVNVVRAVTDETLKEVLYRVLNECDSLKEQFESAGFAEDQKITMIRMSEFGGMVTSRIKFKSFMIGQYAQYNDAVRFTFRSEKKRNDYYCWLYSDVLIYDGWLEVPDELLWEIIPSPTGAICKKSKFLSCDKGQYDVIMNYFARIDKQPIVNTYKPLF